MRNRLRQLVFASGGFALLAGCVQSSPVAPDGLGITGGFDKVDNTVTVPIKGTWNNSEGPPSGEPPPGCAIAIATTQRGNATHLGAFTGTGETCGNPQGPPTPTPPFWHHAPAPPYLVADFTNEMVWVAANGDELWLRPNGGIFVQSLANQAASVRGTLTIAGGTGRFENASGGMTVTGGRGPGEPGDHNEFEGTITLCPSGGC